MKTTTWAVLGLVGLFLTGIPESRGDNPVFSIGARDAEARADERLRLHGQWIAKKREKAREAWALCQANPELRAKGLPLCLKYPRKPPSSRYGPAEPYMHGF